MDKAYMKPFRPAINTEQRPALGAVFSPPMIAVRGENPWNDKPWLRKDMAKEKQTDTRKDDGIFQGVEDFEKETRGQVKFVSSDVKKGSAKKHW